MKQNALIAAILGGLAAGAWAGPIVPAEDAAPGKGAGPAAVRAEGGAAIAGLGERIPAGREAGVSTADKLKRIRIVEIDLQDATLAGAVDFLVQAAKAGDNFSPEAERGINIASSVPETFKTPPIRLQVRNVTILDALKSITSMAGVRYEILQGVVMIVPAKAGAPEGMIVRSYTINQAVLSGIRKTTAKAYFAEMGVTFPEGATVTYNAGLGKIVAVNTAANLKTLDQVVAGLGGRVVAE